MLYLWHVVLCDSKVYSRMIYIKCRVSNSEKMTKNRFPNISYFHAQPAKYPSIDKIPVHGVGCFIFDSDSLYINEEKEHMINSIYQQILARNKKVT